MKRVLLLVLPALCLGCASTQHRAMNLGERTVITEEVATLLDKNQGEMDVRFVEKVRCERIRRVGTHMVTRFCYSSEKARKDARAAAARYARSMGIGGGACSGGNCGTNQSPPAAGGGGPNVVFSSTP